jgi:uncharacterized membrane protein
VNSLGIHRVALQDHLRGALWVLPGVSVLVALVAGSVLSKIDLGRDSPLDSVLFQGTADDARTLLIGITSTMVTVIALLLGLTVVALQLSSTQFSPRLLRNFLRDLPNQIVLSVFVGTFAYSAAGLYTVGVSAGSRTTDYPRLAVTGAIALLFGSLGVLVYFAHHLAHSLQVDAIMEVVERSTLAVIRDRLPGGVEEAPTAPAWSIALPATRSGYVQRVRPDMLLTLASHHGVCIRVQPRVGEHIVAGTPLALIWRRAGARSGTSTGFDASTGSDVGTEPLPDPQPFRHALDHAVEIGFERTFDQDAAFGIRQLVDVASKALSPAVNDPYTAVQSVDHLSVIFCALASRPLGPVIARDASEQVAVIVPARRFGDYLGVMCGQIRRYGAGEPIVDTALLRLLANCAAVVRDEPERWRALSEQADLIIADAAREIAQPADLVAVQAAADSLRQSLRAHLAQSQQ